MAENWIGSSKKSAQASFRTPKKPVYLRVWVAGMFQLRHSTVNFVTISCNIFIIGFNSSVSKNYKCDILEIPTRFLFTLQVQLREE